MKRSVRLCGFSEAIKYVFSGAVLAVAVPAFATAAIQPLRSPRDGKPVPMTKAAYSCPAIAHIAPYLVTDGFYRLDDPTHSIIDAVRQDAYPNRVIQ
jgi:poly(beta-D-mannuronate) lyase